MPCDLYFVVLMEKGGWGEKSANLSSTAHSPLSLSQSVRGKRLVVAATHWLKRLLCVAAGARRRAAQRGVVGRRLCIEKFEIFIFLPNLNLGGGTSTDLVRADGLPKALRLVIHYGKLKKSAFVDALDERLAPAVTSAGHGASLDAFKRQLDAAQLKKGTEFLFESRGGGVLATHVDGKQVRLGCCACVLIALSCLLACL